MEIADKSLMDVGDSAILGHCCSYYSHVLSPAKDGRIIIYVNKITIGEGAFIGTKSNLGPGVVVAPMTKLDVGTNLFVNEKV
jgi:acetyltransferase-like isoleucine patch superfamily enzyme